MDARIDKKIPLKTEKHSSYFYTQDRVADIKEEIEEFISGPGSYMNQRNIAEKFLGCQEIQSNNSVEGYNDDADFIMSVISDIHPGHIPEKRLKIIKNLHQGYQMILEGKEINPDNLRTLYNILSNGILCDYDKKHMGDYYRTEGVDIYYSRNLAKEPDHGLDAEKIEEYMDSLFEYLNNSENMHTMTDHYIKSQIAHFYFVYIHPYFDVNGRTSRTNAMWYLINNEAYPFIIFNRAIPFDYSKYITVIRDTKRFHNLTYFLNFMLSHLKVELEKEYVINTIGSTLSEPLSEEEYQTIRYILSMNGNKTVKDFASFYNRFNNKKHFLELQSTMIEPLLEKEILNFIRYTKGKEGRGANFIFELNPKKIDSDPAKIKRLTL